MSKNYVILNFSDYRAQDSLSTDRTNPVNTLANAFMRRVERKGGSFRIHHVADLFAELRTARHGKRGGHEVEGILTEGWVRTLSLEAAVYRSGAWSSILSSCREADKIVLAAHGQTDDTENVFTEVGMQEVRCGDVAGIVQFLLTVLNSAQKDPTVTLSVCYAARSAEHEKHHINATLTEQDIRSSLAFKIFQGVSESRPGIRLTARTGAVSAEDVGTSLTSETEEAIIAAEQVNAEFPNEDDVVAQASKSYDDFDKTLDQSTLTGEEKIALRKYLYDWLVGGFEPKLLDKILDAIDRLDWSHRKYGASLLWKLSLNSTWTEAHASDVKKLKDDVQLRRRLHELKTIAAQKSPRYGKFVYCRTPQHIYVSRIDGGHITQLAQLD